MIDKLPTADLVAWKKHFQDDPRVLFTNLGKKKVRLQILEWINVNCQDLRDKLKKSQIVNPIFNVLVVGAPNTGKSTLINTLAQSNVAPVANTPGFTVGVRLVKIHKSLNIIDNPGILWPKINSLESGYHLALVNSIRIDVIPIIEVASYALTYLEKHYQGYLVQGLPLFTQVYEPLNSLFIQTKERLIDQKIIGLKMSDIDFAKWIIRKIETNKQSKVCWDKITNEPNIYTK